MRTSKIAGTNGQAKWAGILAAVAILAAGPAVAHHTHLPLGFIASWWPSNAEQLAGDLFDFEKELTGFTTRCIPQSGMLHNPIVIVLDGGGDNEVMYDGMAIEPSYSGQRWEDSMILTNRSWGDGMTFWLKSKNGFSESGEVNSYFILQFTTPVAPCDMQFSWHGISTFLMPNGSVRVGTLPYSGGLPQTAEASFDVWPMWDFGDNDGLDFRRNAEGGDFLQLDTRTTRRSVDEDNHGSFDLAAGESTTIAFVLEISNFDNDNTVFGIPTPANWVCISECSPPRNLLSLADGIFTVLHPDEPDTPGVFLHMTPLDWLDRLPDRPFPSPS